MTDRWAAIEPSGARGAGCGCKLPPDFLGEVLAGLPGCDDPAVLVGPEGFDDGAAYRLQPGIALIGSLDFFTPLVADGATFGAIAATNAVSDIFAMGGRPVFGLAIVAYPRDDGAEGLRDILRGGAAAAADMGCPVLGGHSIDDPEVKYGLAAIGTADPDRLMRNDRARAGDRLVLTKPLGTGIAVAAGEPDPLGAAVRSMLVPNAAASQAALAADVEAATDVTGFGLLGHLHEMSRASGLSASIALRAAPLLPGVAELARRGVAPGGAGRNGEALRGAVSHASTISDTDLIPLYDPQTSGGLLLSVPAPGLPRLVRELAVRDVPAHVIGTLAEGPAGAISVEA
ncbi:MAG: selenide, water dikinase SelD [Thermoleophilia bacterium]|nr:selenide, water dikinase SelD [Thermoleophilia bacterium]MDH3725266.1 selenide, water dikinase SelD [Thermoleophilia bacterium]